MGACLTLERDEMIARKRSEEIDKQLDALAKDRPRILKILLLGAGESGKLVFGEKSNQLKCHFFLSIHQQLNEVISVDGLKIIKLFIHLQSLCCRHLGKSTWVKQMKIIHTDGFSQSELSAFRPTVLDNLLASMKYVLTGMGLLRINLEHSSNKVYAEIVLASPSCFDMEFKIIDRVRSALKVLWKDRGIRLAVARGYDYELNDSAL